MTSRRSIDQHKSCFCGCSGCFAETSLLDVLDIPEANYPEEMGVDPGYCYHCHTGRCPVGVATQDPVLRQRLDPDAAAERVYNFLHTLTIEAQLFARACGKTHLHSLEPEDLAALTMEASAMAGVPLAGTNHTVGVEDYHHL